MTVDKLQRTMWRLRDQHPNAARNDPQNHPKIPNNDLKKAIILEVGHDPRTYKAIRKALITLGWLKTWGKYNVIMTGKDLGT